MIPLLAKPAAGLVLRAAPWAVGGLVVAGLLMWSLSLRADLAACGEAQAKSDLDHERQLREQTQLARQIEAQANAGMAEAFERFEKEKLDAFHREERLHADLRADRLRVRRALTCPDAVSVAGAPAAASVRNGQAQAGLRGEDADFLLREAGRADEVVRQLAACQAVILVYQTK